MYSNKKKLIYLLQSLFLISCLLLNGCTKETKPQKAEEVTFQPAKINYDTVRVTKGNYVSIFSSYDVDLVYDAVEIKSDKEASKFSELRVSVYDEVKEGDIIAVLNTEVSTVNIEEKQLAYERSINQYYSDSKTMIEGLKNQEQAVKQMTDGTDKEIAAIKLEQAKARYEQFQLQNERSLEQQKKEIDKQKKKIDDQNILAPFDGIIFNITTFSKGEKVNPGDTICKLVPLDQIFLGVVDRGDLRYNMEVTVTSKWGKNEKKYQGRVALAKNVAPDGKWQNETYIALDDPKVYLELQNPSISAECVSIKDVLLLDSSVITKEVNSNFVSLYENDNVIKQYISVGKSDKDKAWILQGLSENQEVIIN